jgi:hypothetical protein
VQNGGVLTVDSGGLVSVASGGATTWTSGSTLTTNTGSTANINGAVNIKAGSNVAVKATATMTFEANSQLTAAVSSAVLLHGTNTIDGTQTFGGTTSLGGATTVPNTATVAFAAGSAMSAAATAPFTLNNITTCNGSINIATGATCTIQTGGALVTQSGATVTRGADETRTGKVLLSGTGAYTGLRLQLGSDADHTYDARQFDILQVPALSADRQYKFSNLGTDPVMVMVDRNKTSGGNKLELIRDDLTVFATFTSLQSGACFAYWDGSSWTKGPFSAGVS